MKKLNIKIQKNTQIKSERGSITLYVLISTLFFSMLVTGLYINSSYKAQKQNKEIEKIQEQYAGNINDIYQKAVFSDGRLLSEVVNVGDYVKYTPNAVEKTDESYTQLISDLGIYSGNTDTTYNTSSTVTQESLNWRVLDIVQDENGNDCVRLISEEPTTTKIRLEGYNGYNNAVYLLDKICSTLYNKVGYTEKVQSLKIEDIEKYMVTKPTYSDDTKSFTTLYYPIILLQEKEHIVNGTTGNLGMSEQTELINQTSAQQVTSWSLKRTYWNEKMTTESFTDEKYYTLYINDGVNNYSAYWMSSRCMGTSVVTDAGFHVRKIDGGYVMASDVYRSNTASNPFSYALRPVVTLNSDVLIDAAKSGDGSEIGKEYVIM